MSSRPPSKPDKRGKPKSAPNPKRNQNNHSYQKAASRNRPNARENDTKKVYKIGIRELPSKGFSEENFKECLKVFLEALLVNPESVDVLHFMEGKLSRKRGPLSGAGFICAKDEKSFLSICQANLADIPFFPGESDDSQPQVCIAAYQKRFRGKGRVDKLAGTIEEDLDFLGFQKQLQQPVEKLPSAEVQLEAKEKHIAIAKAAEDAFVKKETLKLKAIANRRDKGRGSASRTERAVRLAVAANLADKASAAAIKNNPLLQFMKEKAEKLISQRNQQSKDQQGKKKLTSVGAKCTSGYGKEREDSNRQGKAKSGRDKNISGVKDGDKTKERMKGIPKDKKDKSKASIEKTKKTSTNLNASDKVKPVTILLKRPETVAAPPQSGGDPMNVAPSSTKSKSGKPKSTTKNEPGKDSRGPEKAKEYESDSMKVLAKPKIQDKNKGKKGNSSEVEHRMSQRPHPAVSDVPNKKKKKERGAAGAKNQRQVDGVSGVLDQRSVADKHHISITQTNQMQAGMSSKGKPQQPDSIPGPSLGRGPSKRGGNAIASSNTMPPSFSHQQVVSQNYQPAVDRHACSHPMYPNSQMHYQEPSYQHNLSLYSQHEGGGQRGFQGAVQQPPPFYPSSTQSPQR